MSVNYSKHLFEASQSEPIFGSEQVKNNAGGYVFEVSAREQLDRFLILGTEGGSYYVNEKKLTIDNATNVLNLIKKDGLTVLKRVGEVSQEGKAASNDPALFVLAMCLKNGNLETRRQAKDLLPRVARTGTHLFHFAEYLKAFGGFGRLTKKAISNWYLQKDINSLQYQLMKYQQRDGWSHGDLIRLAHLKTEEDDRNRAFQWAGAKYTTLSEIDLSGLPKLQAFEEAKKTTKSSEIIKLIENHNLPRECIPSRFLKDPEVWSALLKKMPLNALVRNLGNMSACGTLKEFSEDSKIVLSKLSDDEYIKRSRLHPIAILSALKVYKSGKGVKGSNYWNPVAQIVDALDSAFYKSFDNVEPSGKNVMLALDVSGSMMSAQTVIPMITAAEASAALAMVTVRREQNYLIKGFSHELVDLPVTAKMSLSKVMDVVYSRSFGATDCSMPMEYANKRKLDVDAFVVYTDCETWCGYIHPCESLKKFRETSGKTNAKSIVVSMVPNNFSIADPKDPNMLDVVGFNTSTPSVISSFIS